MTTVTQAVRAVLEPYVGPMVADTCIRATALSLGKTSDDLTSADQGALVVSMRKLLAPVAAPATIDRMIQAFDNEMQVVA